MNPAMTDEKTIERNVLIPTGSVAGECVGVAHVVRGLVDHVDVREADHADDEQDERHGHQGLGKPADLSGGNRQMLGLRGLGLAHHRSPRSIWSASSSFRAMSRLVRCRFVPGGMRLPRILALAADLNASLWRSK